MTIFLISGNGQGAGKTTLAKRLAGDRAVYSIAGILRQELKRLYPDYDWDNRTQAYKDNTLVTEYRAKDPFKVLSLRQVMVEYGQQKCVGDPTHWVKKLVAHLAIQPALSVIAIDDVRKTCELEVLKRAFPNTYHFHVKWIGAIAEPIYEADALEAMADYVMIRNK